LLKNGVVQGSVNAANSITYPSLDPNAYDWHGGSVVGSWGGTWTPSDVNNPTFGAVFSAQRPLFQPTNVSVDHLQMRVCYSTAATGMTPSGFNAFESSSAADSLTGAIKTKIAGAAYGLDLIALDATGAAIDTSFSDDVAVDLIANTELGVALDADNCPTSGATLAVGTRTINNGRSTVSFPAVSDAWRDVRVRIRYPVSSPTVIACSSDNYAIRPAEFTPPMVTDADWQTAGTTRLLATTAVSGGVVHKAGRPFTIAATARSASGATTANYAGTPSLDTTGCVLPAVGCTLGTLTAGSWSTALGTLTSTTAAYSEVGGFSFRLFDATFASVDAADSSVAERSIESAAVSVGRFVPDHFQLSTLNTPHCNRSDPPTISELLLSVSH
jgi:MSHA biogenesis protein MshQ